MTISNSVAGDMIRSVIERYERLRDERDAISVDMREVMAEAKGNGLSPATLRKIVAIRKQDANERAEQEALLDTYLAALGMGPLFDEGEE